MTYKPLFSPRRAASYSCLHPPVTGSSPLPRVPPPSVGSLNCWLKTRSPKEPFYPIPTLMFAEASAVGQRPLPLLTALQGLKKLPEQPHTAPPPMPGLQRSGRSRPAPAPLPHGAPLLSLAPAGGLAVGPKKEAVKPRKARTPTPFLKHPTHRTGYSCFLSPRMVWNAPEGLMQQSAERWAPG